MSWLAKSRSWLTKQARGGLLAKRRIGRRLAKQASGGRWSRLTKCCRCLTKQSGRCRLRWLTKQSCRCRLRWLTSCILLSNYCLLRLPERSSWCRVCKHVVKFILFSRIFTIFMRLPLFGILLEPIDYAILGFLSPAEKLLCSFQSLLY